RLGHAPIVRLASSGFAVIEDDRLDAVAVRTREPGRGRLVRDDERDPRGDLPFLAGDRERLHVGAAPADEDADASAPAHARAGPTPAAGSYSTPGFPFTIVPIR